MSGNGHMKIAVSGAGGFLGVYVTAELRRRGHPVVGWSHRAAPDLTVLDITRSDLLADALESQRPDAVIHLAAISTASACSKESELAYRVNVSATGELARLSARRGIRLIHVSTDLVFDGSHGGWCEEDEPRPLNTYGETKLQGEREVAKAHPGAAIVPPALITGASPPGRNSSTSALLQALERGQRPQMFTDEIRSPVAASDVARAAADLAERNDICGLLHCGGDEVMTRYELACRLAEAAGYDTDQIEPVTREELGMTAERAADLSLDSSRLIHTLGWTPRPLP